MFVAELIVQGYCSTSSIKTKQDEEVNPLPTTSYEFPVKVTEVISGVKAASYVYSQSAWQETTS